MDTISIRPGEPFVRDVTIYTDSTETTLEDLTGGTVTFNVYDAPQGTHLVSGLATITDAANGAAQVSLADTDTSEMQRNVLYGEVRFNEYVVDSFKLIVGG